jgi:hypothetical protein
VHWNIENTTENYIVDLTSLTDHSHFYWDYDQVLQDNIGETTVLDIEKTAFIFSRFHIGNIMHALHDDFIGLYHTIRQFIQEKFDDNKPEYAGNQYI